MKLRELAAFQDQLQSLLLAASGLDKQLHCYAQQHVLRIVMFVSGFYYLAL
jgi:hypothetical protein